MEKTITSRYKGKRIIYNHVLYENPNSNDFDFHTHDICEILLLKQGDVSGKIGARTYKLKKNDLIIFRPMAVHGVFIDSNRNYERYNILFDEKAIANKAFEKLPADLDIISFEGNNYVLDIFNKLDYYYDKFKGNDLKRLILNLVEELVFNLTLAPCNKLNTQLISENPLLNRAIEYIQSNYANQITVEQICKELFISKSHLHHLFADNINISPKKYINLQRLAKAQSLMSNGVKPYEAYLLCGFTDYATFYRNYRNYFGHAPSSELSSSIIREIKS